MDRGDRHITPRDLHISRAAATMRVFDVECRLGIWSRLDYVEPLTAGVGEISEVANVAMPGFTAGICRVRCFREPCPESSRLGA
jgi:hypothetical protein